jgi:hypothetical protein
MTEKELNTVNSLMKSEQLFFYAGAPLNFELEAALVTGNQLYIYPIINGIVFLQKQTALVAKNRTQNPLMRISQVQIDAFYRAHGFGEANEMIVASKELRSNKLNDEQLLELASLLPQKGNCFLSIATHDVDSIHNLSYRLKYENHFHMDFSLSRLVAIQNDLPKSTVLILGDMNCLPFNSDSIDGLFSFDYLNDHVKEIQTGAYEELKRCLKSDGVSIMLYDKEKPLHSKSQLKSDQLSKKTLAVVAPWKKIKLPKIIFHPISEASSVDGNGIVAKASLGQQLS